MRGGNGGDEMNESIYRENAAYPLENHHEDLSDSTQWTISFNLNLGLRMGNNLAFSYSSIGMTCSAFVSYPSQSFLSDMISRLGLSRQPEITYHLDKETS